MTTMPLTCREEILDAIVELVRRSGKDDFTVLDVVAELRRD